MSLKSSVQHIIKTYFYWAIYNTYIIYIHLILKRNILKICVRMIYQLCLIHDRPKHNKGSKNSHAVHKVIKN